MSDELLLLDIYSAGETPIPGVSSEVLAREIQKHASNVTLVTEQNLDQHLNKLVVDGDVILMQGAGSIGQLATNLMRVDKFDANNERTTA